MISKHKVISWAKSTMRIVACAIGVVRFQDPRASFVFASLMVAEFVGILEERYE